MPSTECTFTIAPLRAVIIGVMTARVIAKKWRMLIAYIASHDSGVESWKRTSGR